jgi:predicted DNA-binding transcriptional regulator YafY
MTRTALPPFEPALPHSLEAVLPPLREERDEGAWHVFPLEGALELAYRDVAGNRTRRRVSARELKVGPGRILLGGIDWRSEGYRGFRADRVDWLRDLETGYTVRRNVVDWLLKRAESQARERRKAARAAAA